MKVLFDHQIFSYERHGGISRYFSQLIHHCQISGQISLALSLKYSDNIYLETIEKTNVKPFFNSIYFNKKPGMLNMLNYQYSRKALSRQNFDVFHPTFYNPYFLQHLGSKPFVLTVHDMITELFPNMFPDQDKISLWKRTLIQKADKIIAVSKITKNDIVRIYGIDDAKIEVIYHGSFLTPDKTNNTASLNLPEKYLLFVGKRPFYKNFKRFISAAAPLLKKDTDLSIVCTGGMRFSLDEKSLFKALNITKQICHFIADDSSLPMIYQNALALVLPSAYEGFGIPVLEAFSCGCPAVMSHTGSLKEIGGNAAIYFNPEDEADIRKSIEQVIQDDSLREELRQKGFERIKQFSWDKTAQKTIEVYKTVAQKKKRVYPVKSPIKVLYDHQTFSYEKYGGISRYFSQLMKHYQYNRNCDFDLSLKYSNNHYLSDIDKVTAKPFLNNIYFNKKPGILNRLNINNSIKYLKSQQFDIFHPTFFNPYFLEHIGNKPFVLSVHDMITEVFPDMFSRQAIISEWKTSLIQKAAKIITSSENTKEDIIRFCDISENKVEVVYLGSSLAEDSPKKMPSPILPEKYLLFVGKRPFYKNFDRFIRAIAYLLVMDKKLHVICAGSTKFTHAEKKLFKKLDISDKVFHYPADDRLLVSLYKNAQAFVFPSLYEGFGIPVLEAFSCGCPAIISKTSSLPEIGGKAVMYFNPEDESSIQNAVKKVIYDKNLKNILRQEGYERVRKFTWDHTAQNTLKIYQKVFK